MAESVDRLSTAGAPARGRVQPEISASRPSEKRTCARRHHAARDVETSSAHFEIKARKQREEHRMIGSLIVARHCHPSDIDDPATGFDDQPAGLLGGKPARRRHEAARRDRLFTIPSEHVYRSHVELILLAVIKAAVTRTVVPTLFDDGLVTQGVRGIPCLIVGQGEAISRAGKNAVCEGVK